jgi:carbohydrate binding protein with CBM11 domain
MKRIDGINFQPYQKISLAVKGSGDVALELREKENPDGTAGEHWSVSIPLTQSWKTVSFAWSDFRRNSDSPEGNGVLDLESIAGILVKRWGADSGYLVLDEWRLNVEAVSHVLAPKT